MTKKSKNRFIFKFIIFSLTVIGLVKPMYSQTPERDSTFHPYHVNYWVTGGIITVGLVTENIGIPGVLNKLRVTDAELLALDRNNLNPIDRWALDQDLVPMSNFAQLSDYVTAGVVLLPALTLLDHNIRQDWLDVLLMYAETVTITSNIYLFSPLGPAFQNRLRPVVYYEALGTSDSRTTGGNRNSFYSGHVATAASASFFTATVYCDYHPELGWKKYLVYGAAAIPPLIMSYLRIRALAHFPSDVFVGFGVGALCGIIVPELHGISIEDVSLALYSSFEGTGITLKWRPNFEN